MIDVRCKGCGRMLAKATLMEAAIRCPRCKMIFEYRIYIDRLFVTNSFDMRKHDDMIASESTETNPQNAESTSEK